MNFYLSLFDVSGIQSFIFSSRKASENVGASLLVGRVFEDHLITALQEAGKEKQQKVVTDWEKVASFEMMSNGDLGAEVIYIGGGNALVAFRSKELAVEVTKKFSRGLLEATGGALGVAVAHHKATENFQKDNEELHRILDRSKFMLPNSMPSLGLGVTRDGSTDGLPAVALDKRGLWISRPAKKKREAADAADLFMELFDEKNKGLCEFPKEFDSLGRDKDAGESFIAVVHIDGNGMGKGIKEYLDDVCNYPQAVGKMRRISKEISQTYKDTFSAVVNEFIDVFTAPENADFKNMFLQNKEDKDKNKAMVPLPIRPLIFAGDDVTFVCDGRIALDLSARFMERLAKKSFEDGGFKFPFTACGGIALVKPHFPFYRAYDLAESLCSSAKASCKTGGRAPESCWLDYQIVYSGLPTELDSYRRFKYSVPGMKAPQSGYNLMWRPYCVTGAQTEDDRLRLWDKARENLERLTEKWPRSKLKGLREALCSSLEEAKLFCSECRSREYLLPEDPQTPFTGPEEDMKTQWFDLLELLDSYKEIPWDKDMGGHAE